MSAGVETLGDVLEAQVEVGKNNTEMISTLLADFGEVSGLDESASWETDKGHRSPIRTGVANKILANRYDVEAWSDLPGKTRGDALSVFLDEAYGIHYAWMASRVCDKIAMKAVSKNLFIKRNSMSTA